MAEQKQVLRGPRGPLGKDGGTMMGTTFALTEADGEWMPVYGGHDGRWYAVKDREPITPIAVEFSEKQKWIVTRRGDEYEVRVATR